jgi:DNA mismatch repair protein MutS2
MGVIDAFMEKGCRVVVTTHLNLLKAYGYTRSFAINVATAFDMDSSKALYKLLYGTAGYSNAIHVAKNIGVPSKIIEKSYEYLGKQEYMLNSLISSLETEKKNMVEERKELTGLKEEFKKRLSLLKEKREEYIEKVEEKCRSRLSEMEIEIEEIKKEVAKKERASITRSKGKLKNLRKRFLREEIPEEEKIAIGDFVKVKTLGSSGYVIDEDREGESCEVVIGNVRTKIKKVYLHKITPEGRPPQINPIQIDVQKIEAPQLNIMGLRVEEALKELDIFIDRAMVQGVPSVKIVHGIGTGRLMQAVRSYLSDAGYSKKVRGDEKNAGVTIVELI